MLSPGLAATIGGVKEPADLLRLPILDPGDPWWPQWLDAAGVPVDGLAAGRTCAWARSPMRRTLPWLGGAWPS